jgi:hypothetical protein
VKYGDAEIRKRGEAVVRKTGTDILVGTRATMQTFE